MTKVLARRFSAIANLSDDDLAALTTAVQQVKRMPAHHVLMDEGEPIRIGAYKADYCESLRDGLRLFHNPYAAHALPEQLFAADDVRQFRLRDGEIEVICHSHGDLCMLQVQRIVEHGR